MSFDFILKQVSESGRPVTREDLSRFAHLLGELGYAPDQPEFYAPADIKNEAELLAWRERFDAGEFPELARVVAQARRDSQADLRIEG
jgi:hypothetical protein